MCQLSQYDLGNGKRWSLSYDAEGRLERVNDEPVEMNAGGIPKKVGNVTYQTDANGWTAERGENIPYEVY